MVDHSPLVSVVIIAYNEEKYLSQAIESVLNQTHHRIEVLIVDDGSKDNTLNIARQYEPRVKVISQKNSGGCSSPRNTGARYARGEYIAFLDGDDILSPDKIEMQLEAFRKNTDVSMVIGNYVNFRGDEKHENHFSTCPELQSKFERCNSPQIVFHEGDAASLLIEENFSIAGSPLYLKSAFSEAGGFDEGLFACEDFHLIYRMAEKYKVVVDFRVVFYRRLHGSNMSSNQLKMLRYYCLSRLDLIRIDKSENRKALLKSRVSDYLLEYVKTLIRLKSVAQVKYASTIFIRYLFC